MTKKEYPLPPYLSVVAEGCLLQLSVQPRASRTEIVGLLGDTLKIAVSGPPVDGKANAALCKYLAKRLRIAKSAVRIVRGKTGRRKAILFPGLSPGEVLDRLAVPNPVEK